MKRPPKSTPALVRASGLSSELTAARATIEATEAALAARFHEVRRQGLRTLVEVSVECGRVLLEARVALRGRYRLWLKEQLRLERSTAANYISIATLARAAPALVERHKDLGVSKLYQVARLEPDARDEVLGTPDIATMNDRQFQKVVSPHRKRTRKVTGAMRAHGMRERVKSFSARLAGWRPGRIAEAEARKELRDDLRALRGLIDDVMKRLA